MKHFFIIRSHITYLVSLQVIEKLGLSAENVIFGVHRDYVVDDTRFKQVFTLPPAFQITRNFIKNRCNINKWYKELNSHIGLQYIAYIPYTFDLRLALIVAHVKCKAFSYIEEGLVSYNSRAFMKMNIPWFRMLMNSCIYTSRTLVRFLFERRYFDLTATKLDTCYAVSELSFIEAERRVVLDLVPKGEKKKILYDCVVVFDALSVFKLIESAVLLELLEDVIIPHIKKSEFKNIAYKLHPEHYTTINGKIEGEQIRDIMAKYFADAIELDRTVSLEVYFSQHLTSVYSYVSSLGYYGILMGCASYRLTRRLTKINPKIHILDEVEDEMQQL